MDWFNPDFEGRPVIVDLKTCDNLSFFERDARKYGYPIKVVGKTDRCTKFCN